MATFEDQDFGHYREVAFIEELFRAQTVYLGPGCLAIIERFHYNIIPFFIFFHQHTISLVLGGFYRYSAAAIPAFLASLCTIFIERKSR